MKGSLHICVCGLNGPAGVTEVVMYCFFFYLALVGAWMVMVYILINNNNNNKL